MSIIHENPELAAELEFRRWKQVRPEPRPAGALYELGNGWDLWLPPGALRIGDKVHFTYWRKGAWGKQRATVERTAVVGAQPGQDNVALAQAFDVLGAWVLGPAVKQVLLRENGDIVFGLDSRHYADLKLRLGHGLTQTPLDPMERFHHGRFLFYILAAHPHERGIGKA